MTLDLPKNVSEGHPFPPWAWQGPQRTRNSRARVGSLIALEGMGEVVLIVHVALCAEVIVEADAALPTHAAEPMFLTAVTDDVGVPDTWGQGGMGSVGGPRGPHAPHRPCTSHAPICALS